MVPYNRAYPLAICQDDDLLLSITEFDYDLTVDDFVRYFENRTGYKIKYPTKDGRKVNWQRTKAVFGDVKKEPAEMWEKILKGKLQDCWEIWREGKGPGIWNRKGVL